MKQTQNANMQIAQASTRSGKATGLLVQSVQGLVGSFGQGGLVGATRAAASGLMSLIGPAGMTAAALIGVAVAAKEIVEIGVHGSIVTGVEESFKRIQNSADLSARELLESSHEAAAGLTSDFNIMRQANILMAGATKDTVEKLTESFPRLLEISRLQARATGGEVDYYFNSLVQGIKRAEPRLIDNTGLIIKVGEATKAYASALDITTQEMTAEDKTIAILNATLAAGNRALISYGDMTEEQALRVKDLGEQFDAGRLTIDEYNAALETMIQTTEAFVRTTAYEELQRIKTSFEEIRNDIGQALEPLARGILSLINSVIEPFKQVIDDLAPAFGAVLQIVGDLLSGFGQVLGAVLSPILNVVKVIGEGILKTIVWISYAIAGTLMWVANTIIFPVVIKILETLASWLVGESPPPAGPLKDIDKGAENIMHAWVMGLAGVSLDPVEQVVKDVADVMGAVAFWDRDTVEARLKALDEALRPFDERLQLVKANFEAMKEPVEAAFREIDRQLETAVKAMLAGDTQAAALVRQLDAQRQALTDYTNAQQQAIDNAAIQLAYAKSQQALERQILLIQQSRLGPEEKEQKIKELKAKALKGAGDASKRVTSPVVGSYAVEEEKFGFNADVQAFIDQATGFMGVGGMFADQQAQFETNKSRVGDLWSKIQSGEGFANLTKGIEDVWNGIFGENGTLRTAFSGFATWIDNEIVNGPIGKAWGTLKGIIKSLWGDLFTDEDSFLRSGLGTFLNYVKTNIEKGMIGDAFTKVRTTVEGIWDGLVGEKGFLRVGLWDGLAKIKSWLEDGPIGQGFTILRRDIETTWNNLFGESGTIRLAVESAFITLRTDIETGVIGQAFTTLRTSIETIWEDLFGEEGTIRVWAENAFSHLKYRLEEGPIGEGFTTLRNFLENGWNALFGQGGAEGEGKGIFVKLFEDAMASVGRFLEESGLKTTFQDTFNAMQVAVDNVATAIQTVIDKVAALVEAWKVTPPAWLDLPGIPGSEEPQFKTPSAQGKAVTRKRAGGGSVRGGLEYLVGEYGPEVLRLPPGLSGWIDNNSVTQNKMYASLFGGGASMPYPTMPSMSNTTSYDSSTNYGNIVFNGVQNSDSAMRRFSMLRMMRR